MKEHMFYVIIFLIFISIILQSISLYKASQKNAKYGWDWLSNLILGDYSGR